MKIVILEPIGILAQELKNLEKEFSDNNHELITYNNRPESESDIIKRATKADILVLSNLPLSETIIEQCPNLKLISVAFAGTDHIPVEFCKKKNILVCNAAGYSTHAVAELTIGMTINLLRKIVWSDYQTREGKTRVGFLGTELYGKTFGIIGYGQIGAEVARLANAFGCNVLAYNRTKKQAENITFVDLNKLLRESDIISLHVPLTSETKNLIGEKELNILKPTSILINTARGQVVDYNALYNALKENKLAGAALDVYEKEPPLNTKYPLFELPNVLLLPHIGYATNEAIDYRGKIVFENIRKWMNGEPQNTVN
ncbi:MAG: hydroxyacid dehydrogenase [Bacteroidetes bacterium GWF2_33_16]|nr:MAG: hydroxyacid dehydrogenase [Bacteroidetes bacterium GWE2_32_14]OFY07702.1 MAG: hydroxyacid dehydrogenase [Bacteroidetes bacterium GWF2_33_16]